MENLIEEALTKHNCIIIPNFGGFITRESPCGYTQNNQFLKPETVSVFFNVALTQNDGTLLNFINQKLNCGYDEASKMLNQFIEKLNNDLKNNGFYKFGNLGKFFINQQDVKWFVVNPDLNLSLKNYGLFPVEVQKIEREKTKVQEIKSWQADRVEIEQLPDVNKKWNWKPWVAAASIALVSHFVYLNFDNKNITHASVSDTITNIDSKTNETSLPNENNSEINDNLNISENIIEDSIIEVVEESPEILKETPVLETNTQVLVENTSPNIEQTTLTIARYRLKNNADFHLNDLIKQGKNAEINQSNEYYLVIVKQ